MFTQRFLKMPIRLHNQEMESLTGMSEEFETYEMVNPFDIMSYRPSKDPDGFTYVTFKNNTGMVVYMSIKDFEKLLNSRD